MTSVNLDAAATPLALAIDVGSSSVRALVFDARGRQVEGSERQITYTLATTSDGGSTADADALVDLVARCVDHVLHTCGHHTLHIAAVGVTTFWHALLGLDQASRPVTPVLMWADTRSNVDARVLAAVHDSDAIHRLTGCRLHSSYWPAKLRWLQRMQPDAVRNVVHWVSFADYLVLRLHGVLRTSISLASGTGMMDAANAEWSEPMLSLAGIRREQLPPIVDRDAPLPPLLPEWQARWPALGGAIWFPALGDGATANVGSSCVGADRIALTIGTSGAMRIIVDATDDIPVAPELWRYRLDRHSIVIGGALSNGGNIITWLAGLVGDRDFDALMAEATRIAPDAHGLTVLPLLAGERSPSWDDRFGGTISGLRLDTTAGDLFRAFLEATAYRFAAIYDGLKPHASPEHDIFAGGGAALGSPLWLQIIADALDHALFALGPGAEASARGAAICSLHSIGVLDSIRVDPGSGMELYAPESGRQEVYQAARLRQQRLETAIRAMPDPSL